MSGKEEVRSSTMYVISVQVLTNNESIEKIHKI